MVLSAKGCKSTNTRIALLLNLHSDSESMIKTPTEKAICTHMHMHTHNQPSEPKKLWSIFWFTRLGALKTLTYMHRTRLACTGYIYIHCILNDLDHMFK